jgi:hypothetical protein
MNSNTATAQIGGGQPRPKKADVLKAATPDRFRVTTCGQMICRTCQQKRRLPYPVDWLERELVQWISDHLTHGDANAK